MTAAGSARERQLAAWDAALERDGRVEIGYGGRSVVYLSVLVLAFVALGVWMLVSGDDVVDRFFAVVIIVLLGGGGLVILLGNAIRPGAPLVVDAFGVHLKRPRRDVPWETVRNAYVLRGHQGPTVALVVVRPDGTTTSIELGRLIGRDRKTLAAWLATKARARSS